jgi:hypothetical protein
MYISNVYLYHIFYASRAQLTSQAASLAKASVPYSTILPKLERTKERKKKKGKRRKKASVKIHDACSI